MKCRILIFLCVILTSVLISGCTIQIKSAKLDELIDGENTTTQPETTTVSDTITGSPETAEQQTDIDAGSSDIDVDLTVMSSTMVYAEVFNILSDPYSYLGKRIKVSGVFNPYYWDETDRTYYYVVISDATACCKSGLEFMLNNENSVYPQEGESFEISGTYQSYVEQGRSYYYIAADELKTL